jgi:hypothetical protein
MALRLTRIRTRSSTGLAANFQNARPICSTLRRGTARGFAPFSVPLLLKGRTGKQGAPVPGPATSSDLDGPWGVAVDGKGDLFIADYNEVEEVTPGRYALGRRRHRQAGCPGARPRTRPSHLVQFVPNWRGGGRQRRPLHRR